jgi:ABC-type transport system involved in cytochrome c biogenesis permease subunit
MQTFNATVGGAILISAWAIALFFYRFWRKTRDPLFAFFSAAFFLLGVERICILAAASEVQANTYLIRLVAFVLILFAIFHKNRRRQ